MINNTHITSPKVQAQVRKFNIMKHFTFQLIRKSGMHLLREAHPIALDREGASGRSAISLMCTTRGLY